MRISITRQGKRLIYIGIACYLVFLFYTIPASFLTRYIVPSIPAAQAIELTGVSGTIWAGQAINANLNRFNLGKFQWDLSGWRLLLGSVALDMNFTGPLMQGSGNVSVGLQGAITSEDLQINMAAGMFTPLFYGLPISFDGDIRGNIESLQFEQGQRLNAKGRVIWYKARLETPQTIELGDYVATLEPANRGTKIIIKDTSKGPIETNLTIQLKGTGEYKINGSLKARDQGQQHIIEALRLIGRADNSGRYWIVRNGKLRGW